jgi:uncharacterized protein YkwD
MQTPRKPSFRPTLECLEDRSLMSAHLSASLSGGLLRIQGTAGADTIVVREIHNQISVDGVKISVAGHAAARVSASAVAGIEVFGNSGNDRIYLNSQAVRGQQALTRPVTVWGGAGNDLIVAGQGPETVYGGAGNDVIYGGAGKDRLYGEGGNDILVAGSGPTLLDGGAGTNLLVGGRGNDTFVSHSPHDIIHKGRGHSTIVKDYKVPKHAAAHATVRKRATVHAAVPKHATVHSAVHAQSVSASPSAPASFQQQIDQIVAMENAYRASRGLNTLTFNSELTAAARYQATYMARTGVYSHTDLDGRTLADRVTAAGYSYNWVGENIHLYVPSIGRTTGISQYFPPSQLAEYYFEGWRASAEHNANLLSPNARQIGVAIVQADNGNVYADMVLGRS